MYDSVGSIVIGLSLGFVALVLIRKNRDLLVGSAVSWKALASTCAHSHTCTREGSLEEGEPSHNLQAVWLYAMGACKALVESAMRGGSRRRALTCPPLCPSTVVPVYLSIPLFLPTSLPLCLCPSLPLSPSTCLPLSLSASPPLASCETCELQTDDNAALTCVRAHRYPPLPACPCP